MAEAPTSPGIGDLTPALDVRWHEAEHGHIRRLGAALAAAFAAHLLIVWLIAGGLELLAAGLLGAPPAERRLKAAGDRAGLADGVAVEVIDAAELDRRYVAFTKGRDSVAGEAAPAARPRQQPASPSPEAPKPDAQAGEGRPAARPAPRSPASEALSEADMRELLASSMAELEDAFVAVEAAGAARLGEASPFVRNVVRTLKRSMPRAPGMRGTVVVRLVVGPAGEVAAIAVVRSSGRPALDELVLDRVRATRLPAPTPATTLRERQFQIAYEYR